MGVRGGLHGKPAISSSRLISIPPVRKISTGTAHPAPLNLMLSPGLWSLAVSGRLAVHASLPPAIRIWGSCDVCNLRTVLRWKCCSVGTQMVHSPMLALLSLVFPVSLPLCPLDHRFRVYWKQVSVNVTRLTVKLLLDSGGDFYRCRICCSGL